MELKTGDKIKIFPNTNISSYLAYIKSEEGFNARVENGYIVIGEPYEWNRTSHYGNQIKRARKKKGWTRKQLAEKCGVKESTVLDWEFGRRRPKDWKTVQRALGGLE